MIFQPELIEKILAGEKTETRRKVKPGEMECRYKPGRAYVVQDGRGRPGIARIKVLSVCHERLGDIDPQSARAEGVTGSHWFHFGVIGAEEQFFAYWRRIHGEEPDMNQEVWVIRFKLRGALNPVIRHDGGMA